MNNAQHQKREHPALLKVNRWILIELSLFTALTAGTNAAEFAELRIHPPALKD